MSQTGSASYLTRVRWAGLFMGATILIGLPVVLSRRDKPVEIQIVHAVRTQLDASITSNGKVEPVDPHIVRAQFPTFIASIPAVEGQSIRRGQPILTLESTDIVAQLAQARAELLAAQNDLRFARAGGSPDEVAELSGKIRTAEVDLDHLRRTHESLSRLVAKQAATRDELDQNEAALADGQSKLDTLTREKEDLSNRAELQTQSGTL